MVNVIRFDDFEDSHIRVTDDGRVSVYDVIQFCGKKNPRDTWKSLCEQHSEVVGKTDNLQFSGKGQRETPVATRENILYIIGLLPGAIGKSYRESAAKVFLAYMDASPELAESIIDRAKPEDLQRIETRLKGKKIRITFTSVLQDHGVKEGWQFGVCTNEIYKPILGGDAKALKQQRNLPARANVRDSMDDVELSAVMLAESLASRKINKENIQGFDGCRSASKQAGEKVSKAIEE